MNEIKVGDVVQQCLQYSLYTQSCPLFFCPWSVRKQIYSLERPMKEIRARSLVWCISLHRFYYFSKYLISFLECHIERTPTDRMLRRRMDCTKFVRYYLHFFHCLWHLSHQLLFIIFTSRYFRVYLSQSPAILCPSIHQRC